MSTKTFTRLSWATLAGVIGLVISCLILTVTCTRREAVIDFEAEKQVIRETVKEGFEAEQRKDLDAIVNYFAENVIVQGPNMPQIKGRAALRDFYTEFFKVLISIEGGTTDIFISESGDMAWDYGWNREEYKGPDGPIQDEGKYLEIWKKINNEWKVVAISFSSDKPLM